MKGRLCGAHLSIVLMLLVTSCANNNVSSSAPTSTNSGSSAVESPELSAAASPSVPTTEPLEVFPGFDAGTVSGDVGPLPVLLAQTSDQRRQGLMGVEDLRGWSGMWFEFSEVGSGGFWMKDTLLPLSIAWIDTAGIVVAVADMEPCAADPCPSYEPGADYISALEVEQGQLVELGIELGTRLLFSR